MGSSAVPSGLAYRIRPSGLEITTTKSAASEDGCSDPFGLLASMRFEGGTAIAKGHAFSCFPVGHSLEFLHFLLDSCSGEHHS
jgi:hypothetical protein